MNREYGKNSRQVRELRNAWLLSIVFMFFLAGLVYVERLHPAIPGFYALASVYTFLIFARDKSAAKNGRWRISEKHLHLAALLGGWPGALVARKTFRHKTGKQSFRVVFWLMVLVNSGTLFLLVFYRDSARVFQWIITHQPLA